jgi:hypothetical protein
VFLPALKLYGFINMRVWLFIKLLTSTSAAFLLLPLCTRNASWGLIFEVTKERPKPHNPAPTTGFEDNRMEGGEVSSG